MKQEHDFEGALKAIDIEEKHLGAKKGYLAYVINSKHIPAIRAALTAAKGESVTFKDVQSWASLVVSDIEGGYSSEEVKTANAICYATAGEPPQDGGDDV